MNKIDTYIEELLHNHDCVIIPEFGGFITSKKPAFFNQFTSVFFPASKRILFNKHLVFNDGLLASKIAEKKQLSIENAKQLLIEFKDDCYVRLNEEGKVEIERVGVLFFDKEKNIQFQQGNVNFLTDSYGLTTVSLDKIAEKKPTLNPVEKPISVVRPVEVKADRKPEIKQKVERTKKRKTRAGNLVPLLIIPLLAAGFYVGVKQNSFDKKV